MKYLITNFNIVWFVQLYQLNSAVEMYYIQYY